MSYNFKNLSTIFFLFKYRSSSLRNFVKPQFRICKFSHIFFRFLPSLPNFFFLCILILEARISKIILYNIFQKHSCILYIYICLQKRMSIKIGAMLLIVLMILSCSYTYRDSKTVCPKFDT